MARGRHLYDEVMDVALRATLKEFGFKRKTRATYIMDRSERRWYFELEAEPRLGIGFEAMPGVHIPALEAICEKHIPGVWVFYAFNRTKPHAHVTATIPLLMEIAEGHDFYTKRRGPASDSWSREYESAQNKPVMQFQNRGWWVLPPRPMIGELGYDEDELDKITCENIKKLGYLLDNQWRAHVPTWYERCDDPLFVIDWLDKHQPSGGAPLDLTSAVLYHLAGKNGLAAECLRKTVQKAEISYDELYREIYRERGGSWLYRLYYPGTWTKERVAESTVDALERRADRAEAARRLAHGLGIRL